MRRPSRTPPTIETKRSSRSTRSAASRATSVPRWPMAMPIWAASSAGASLTPSPVMATTSPSAFSASTSASFCSGMTRAKTRDPPHPLAQRSAVEAGDSLPVSTPRAVSIPAWRAISRAVAG